MAMKQLNAREPISGFWTRNGALEGTLLKFRKGATMKESYFLFRATMKTPVVTRDEQNNNQVTQTVDVGSVVAVAACSALECLENAKVGTKVRIESNGKKPTKDKKNEYWDFAVFADDGEDDESDVPIS